jgi:S1-C subfamily serine protease
VVSPFTGLEVDEDLRPDPDLFDFDLDARLSSVVALQASVDEDAYTAGALGTERIGNAVVIGAEGLVLTIGYLVTEAAEVILTARNGRAVPAHVLGVDQATGFGLVHALEPLDLPALTIGDSARVRPGDALVSAGAGGRDHALTARLLARQPFSGYWEYHLDQALFVGPAHPHWSGAALIGPRGELVGVGSLRMEQRTQRGEVQPLNMFVPAELLPPILDDLSRGRPATPPRPWVGVFAQDFDGRVVIIDVSPGGPAAEAGLRSGDLVRAVGGRTVSDLAAFYTAVWALGPPGAIIPLTLQRGERIIEADVHSIDRTSRLKKRRLN